MTGASRGIGAAIARMLAQMGADVAINHLADGATAEQLATELHALGRRAAAFDVDVARKDIAAALVAPVVAALGQVDVLVISAARLIYGTLETVSDADVDAQVETNFKATARLLNAVVPAMAKRGFGRVVTIGSITQEAPLADRPDLRRDEGGALQPHPWRGRPVGGARRHAQQRVARADPHRAQRVAARTWRRLGRVRALVQLRAPRGRARGSRLRGRDVLRARRVVRHRREPVRRWRRADRGATGRREDIGKD